MHRATGTIKSGKNLKIAMISSMDLKLDLKKI
jgi:hypothetical protein